MIRWLMPLALLAAPAIAQGPATPVPAFRLPPSNQLSDADRKSVV